MVKQMHMVLRAGLVFLAAMVVGIATMASAQATPSPGKGDVWQAQRTSAKAALAASTWVPTPAGALARYYCYPPTRYYNAATWNCTVRSGAIVFWIECSIGGTYTSAPHGPGNYFVRAQCPQGRRLSEGVRAVS
ncbi:hypothetical protein [Streptomyces sp. NPDC047071]|uniref:hypothetical protein n=1 Tax=Streptomyces sp. NPDC047071 TaxID=3154808 RepID=UPI003452200C